MQDLLDKLYKENLELAREEGQGYMNAVSWTQDDMNDKDFHNMAVSWTQDDIMGKIEQYLDGKYWKQDSILEIEKVK